MWKYLRIAVTAVSLFVCVLLIGLWVRSYMYEDQQGFKLTSRKGVLLRSCAGELVFSNVDTRNSRFPQLPYVVRQSCWLSVNLREANNKGPVRHQGLPRFKLNDNDLFVPHWFLITITATIAALPWLKWRFSLRTLLIVMTLFALFFGAIAMSMRG